MGRIWDTTEGFFSRWVVVPFSAFFPATRADPMLIDVLVAQRSLQGLLRMAVGGLQNVMRRGAFTLPPSVLHATERFKQEADPVRAFIEEACRAQHPNSASFTARMEFYVAYTAWAGMNGFHQMAAARFYESFLAAAIDQSDAPIRAVTVAGNRGFKGIELT